MKEKLIKLPTEKELGFRPLINQSKIPVVKQLFNGYEIEKKFILATKEEDYTKKKNALIRYNQVLEEGVLIQQGYIKDIQVAINMLNDLGIEPNDFKPNTIRLRRIGNEDIDYTQNEYILTLKDKKETKKREVEFELKLVKFNKYWELTKGARIYKKRLEKTIKGRVFEFDAFLDRFLLVAECEVTDEKELDKIPVLGMDVTNDNRWSNKNLSK